MELSPNSSVSSRQRSSPANDPSTPTTPSSGPQHQQPYAYPLQQPQAGWPVSAQPYYPQFYQNQQPYGIHGHPAHVPPQQVHTGPYYDHNAQLAHWTYQHMMLSAHAQQAHQIQQIPPQHQHHAPHTPQRTASASTNPATPTEYFNQNQLFSPFPSGTPPPHQQQQNPGPFQPPPPQQQQQQQPPTRAGSAEHLSQQQQQQQHNGFHPYRRPNRGGGGSGGPGSDDWRGGAPPPVPSPSGGAFQPPYARGGDASASSSSVNSGSSAREGGARQRTSSTQGSASGHGNANGNGSVRSRTGSGQSPPPPPQQQQQPDAPRSRTGSNSSATSASARPHLHHRTGSSSSTNSASAPRPSASTNNGSATTANSASAPGAGAGAGTPPAAVVARQPRPSPLSQSTYTAGEKRMSRDDSDLQAMLADAGGGERAHHHHRGIKGRLRRALSLNASQTLQEEDEDDASSTKANAGRRPVGGGGASGAGGGAGGGGGSSSRPSTSSVVPMDAADSASTATRKTKKRSRAASLFNPKLNASTDNISLSSTMSSASMVIRKLGSIGNLARRNSLAGITSLFKDKDKNKDKDKERGSGSGSGMEDLDNDETPIGADAGELRGKKGKRMMMKKSKGKDGSKGAAAEPSVSHAHAELDRTSDWSSAGGVEMSGLSPAAKLARQHTLKSNAEAAAKAKAQQEAQAAAVAATAEAKQNGGAPVPAWEKNTTTGRGGDGGAGANGSVRVSEDGSRILEEDEESEDGHYYGAHPGGPHEGWDDDEWPEDEEEEEATIRMERTHISGDAVEDGETVTWAQNIRRSVERARQPTKGILKGADGYSQNAYLADSTNTQTRGRANSENARPVQPLSETPSLTHIPSSDPDQIDGLHRHSSQSSAHRSTGGSGGGGGPAPFLPPLTIDTEGLSVDSPKEIVPSVGGSTASSGRSSPQKGPGMFTLSNSSAPVLSSMPLAAPAGLTHRSATTPAKRLAFANNLSVYDTFSAQVYDRRSEPATWSRLTPALAQQIKEELNSYKMEEMEVHASSRMHTQFFI